MQALHRCGTEGGKYENTQQLVYQPHRPDDLTPAFGSLIYDNSGPDSGKTSGFIFDSTYEVSDSFTLTSDATIASIDFLAWTDAGATLTTIDWSISGTDFGGGTVYGDASGAAVTTNSTCSGCGSGGTFDIDSDAISGLSVSLAAGTYYLTLGSAVTSDSGLA